MAAKHRAHRKKRPCKTNYNATTRWVTNRLKRIARHLKKYPNDAQAQKALTA